MTVSSDGGIPELVYRRVQGIILSQKKEKMHSIEIATAKGVGFGCGELEEEKGRECERYRLEFKQLIAEKMTVELYTDSPTMGMSP